MTPPNPARQHRTAAEPTSATVYRKNATACLFVSGFGTPFASPSHLIATRKSPTLPLQKVPTY